MPKDALIEIHFMEAFEMNVWIVFIQTIAFMHPLDRPCLAVICLVPLTLLVGFYEVIQPIIKTSDHLTLK